jgi:hypothetical protein
MRIYVVEGNRVLPRLQEHHKRKEFWTELIASSATDNGLNRAHVKYWASRLVSVARAAKQCEVENDVRPALPSLPEAEVAYAERLDARLPVG